MKDPVLAVRSFSKGTYHQNHVPFTFKIEGGLHNLRGNKKPYFSITANVHRKGFPNQCWSGGCLHEDISKYFPRFRELIDFHLCDIDGVPMHDAANGWYYLAGVLPENAGQEYHIGNAHYGTPKNEDEIFDIVAKHFRISVLEARSLRDFIVSAAIYNARGNKATEVAGYAATGVLKPAKAYDWVYAKEVYRSWLEAQKTRWKAEADHVIRKFNLKIYGDPLQ